MTEPPGWILDQFKALRSDMQSENQRVREEVRYGFVQLREEMRIQNGRVNVNTERLTVLETQHEMEERASVKRGAMAGILASIGLTALVKFAESLWHR